MKETYLMKIALVRQAEWRLGGRSYSQATYIELVQVGALFAAALHCPTLSLWVWVVLAVCVS